MLSLKPLSLLPTGKPPSDTPVSADAGALFDALGLGLVVHDAGGRILSVNRTFTEMTGFSDSELRNAASPYPFALSAEDYLNVAAREVRMELRRKSGAPLAIAVTTTPVEQDGQKLLIAKFRNLEQAEHLLARLVAQVDSHRQRLGDIVANVPGVVWEAYGSPDAASQRIDFVSRYVEPMLGYSVDEWLSTPDFWLSLVHPEDRERAARTAAEAFQSGKDCINTFRWITRDGRILWVEATSTVIFDENGKPIGMRGVTMDVTERRRRQRALRRRARQLERSAKALKAKNEELDQFAYIASHDLRAPLRGIANLSNWIEEDMGDRFTPEAHKQMELLRGRVHRMENLINGLLEFSRIGRANVAIEQINLNDLLREVADLAAPPKSVTLHVQHGLPAIPAERVRIQQIFLNLIGNAIKHRGDGTRPLRIDVSSRDVGDSYEFTVADDGPGIPPEYHDRIFVIFQTLVARDKVEGTGVGLALVKKIVENHGGAIRVESAPGAGARFIFTWPKKPKKSNDTKGDS